MAFAQPNHVTSLSTPTATPLNAPHDDEKTLATKTRIITHMNADHNTSLSLYLRAFNAIPANQTHNAKLTAISLDHLVIVSNAGRNLIPLTPPMKDYSEARTRMVEMHHEALKKLGLSDIVIDEYRLPRAAWQWILTILCLACFTTFPFPSSLAPPTSFGLSSLPYYFWSIGGFVPKLAKIAETRATRVLRWMVVIHAIEAGMFARGRLRKHQVKVGSGAWFCWVVNTFVSGFGSTARFGEVVKGKEVEKEGKKH